MLKREGPFSVFAPTDETLVLLPPGTLDRLLAQERLSRKSRGKRLWSRRA
jgi:uncharacterized surface protein with fasciclin (FAS1) repeats